jgi:hypothetical protein
MEEKEKTYIKGREKAGTQKERNERYILIPSVNSTRAGIVSCNFIVHEKIHLQT